MKKKINDSLEESYAKSKNLEYKAEDWVTEEWAALKEIPDIKQQVISGIPLEEVRDLGRKITILP
jgi:2-oxoglutarate dehydrogenase complex dehydrogenase (E1) component-like enzyme